MATGGYDGQMKTVGIRALKSRLSEYLRLVRDGERLAITNRGIVAARLVPPDASDETSDEALERLARAGELRLGKPNRPDLYSPPPGLLSEEEIRSHLDWVRGDR